MNLFAILLLAIVASIVALLSTTNPGSGSIHFNTLAPKTDEPLRIGELIKIRAEASYRLRGEVGTASFYVQDKSVVLAKRDVKLDDESGNVAFEASVFVPDTKEFTVSVALFEAGEDSSLVNERLEYIVSEAE